MPVTGSRMAKMPAAMRGEVVAIVMIVMAMEVVMAVRKAVTEKSVAEAMARAVSTAAAAFGRGADVGENDRKANGRNGGDGLS